MPWKESSVMDERLRFVARLLEGEEMTAMCREFGISRKTGYKILNRYKEEGVEALCGPLTPAGAPRQSAPRPGGAADCRSQAREAALGSPQDQGTANVPRWIPRLTPWRGG